MKHLLLLWLALIPLVSAAPEARIELIPQRPMGVRAQGNFSQIECNADSNWFGKPAPVCKAITKPMNLSKFHELARSYEMSPFWNQNMENLYSKQSDGTFHYRSKLIGRTIRVASGSPKSHQFMFKVVRYFDFERDEHQDAIVKPLPSREEAVVIAREWVKKLRIDENELYRGGEGPGGFDVVFRTDFERGYKHGTMIDMESHYGMTLNFAQQIGGLAVLWHGHEGTLICEIGDGSEFCSMSGKLTGWKK